MYRIMRFDYALLADAEIARLVELEALHKPSGQLMGGGEPRQVHYLQVSEEDAFVATLRREGFVLAALPHGWAIGATGYRAQLEKHANAQDRIRAQSSVMVSQASLSGHSGEAASYRESAARAGQESERLRRMFISTDWPSPPAAALVEAVKILDSFDPFRIAAKTAQANKAKRLFAKKQLQNAVFDRGPLSL